MKDGIIHGDSVVQVQPARTVGTVETGGGVREDSVIQVLHAGTVGTGESGGGVHGDRNVQLGGGAGIRGLGNGIVAVGI